MIAPRNAKPNLVLLIAAVCGLLAAACVGRPEPVALSLPAATATETASPAPALPPPALPEPTSTAASATATPAPSAPPAPTASATSGLAEAETRVGATGETSAPIDNAPVTPIAETARPASADDGIRTIVLDPGHGGPESGAVSADYGLIEADLNLDIALRAADLLREAGYRVELTREADVAVDPTYRGGGYAGGVGRDLQGRIDIANRVRADLFLSVHNNGSNDSEVSGTEVWYNSQRPFGDRNEALAEIALDSLVAAIREAGYPTVRRGVWEDSRFRIFQGQPFNIYVLGPGNNPRRSHEPTHMPGVLLETLFLSNAADARALSRPAIRQAIAAGYLATVERYFDRFPE